MRFRVMMLTAVTMAIGFVPAVLPASASAESVTAHSASVSHIPAVANTVIYRHRVSPHTSDYTAVFNGTIEYGYQVVSGKVYYYIDIDGTLESLEGNFDATLYVRYTPTGGSEREVQIGKTTTSKTITWSTSAASNTFKDIEVFVCTNYNGFRCSGEAS
jgi:hypothetical protein